MVPVSYTHLDVYKRQAGYGGAISVYAADRYWNGNASVKISGNAEITQNTGRNGGGAIALLTSKANNYTSTVEMLSLIHICAVHQPFSAEYETV